MKMYQFLISISTEKANTHTQYFASNIAEQATNGGADEPAFAITIAVQTIKKTEVGEASDKILDIWTHAIFLIYHTGDKRMLR